MTASDIEQRRIFHMRLADTQHDCIVFSANQWIARHPHTPLPLGISIAVDGLPQRKHPLIERNAHIDDYGDGVTFRNKFPMLSA